MYKNINVHLPYDHFSLQRVFQAALKICINIYKNILYKIYKKFYIKINK